MAAMRFCFLLFCVFVASVSSVEKLNNINDLRNTRYANSEPRHGRQLLFWFAQNVNLDQNNHMHLNFLPDQNVFGFHYFGNRDRPALLPSLSPEQNQNYYSVGNLNYRQARDLPDYVRQHYRNSNLPERNMDRIIVPLDQNQPTRISRVFITSHNRNRNNFNASDTYEIDPALIQQIRQADQCIDSHTPLIYNTEEERCLHFLQQTGYISNCSNIIPRKKRCLVSQCERMKLEIKTTTEGYLKLRWENIPANIFKTYKYIYIDICQNTYSSDTDEDPTRVRKQYFTIDKSFGLLDTSVLMNDGLQPRLRLYKSYISRAKFWYGPEFDGANRVLPIRIKGFDASLQLYAEDGKACARLYIKKTFSNWKDVFSNSWVGFYKSSQDNNNDYHTYGYAVKFAMIYKTVMKNYDIYQYNSSLPIAPGVQIRFLLDNKYEKVLAQTTPWESEKKVTSVCDKPSFAWYFPEFFNEPELYDANNVVPSKIPGYDAGLQLFTKDGKACARLYIKKTFKNWKDAFHYSWVGFYTSPQDKNNKYDKYQYAVNFEKIKDGTENFDIYQYKSELSIAPGLQIRFMMDESYDKELVATEPWKNG